MHYSYPAKFTKSGDSILVTFRDLREANTFGNDRADAIASATDCLDVALLFRLKYEERIPEPSAPKRGEIVVPASPQVAAKVAFALAFKESGLSRVALAKKIGCAESEVRRLLDPNHATKLDRIDLALRALGRRLVISDETLAA